LGNTDGSSFTGDFERNVRFFGIRRLFFRGSEHCVKEGSGNGHISFSIGAPMEDMEGMFVYRGIRETVKQGSGNGESLSMGAL
jgi:hypothetical protein